MTALFTTDLVYNFETKKLVGLLPRLHYSMSINPPPKKKYREAVISEASANLGSATRDEAQQVHKHQCFHLGPGTED